MMRYAHILLGMLLLTSCYKDEVDIDALNYNPFDRDYEGPAMFEFVSTYQQAVTIGGVPTVRQIIEFRVREDRFLEPAVYSVHVTEQGGLPQGEYLSPDPPGTNIFKHITGVNPGATVCLELRLANNLSVAGAEVMCVPI
jgi:hypothetical protein